MNMGGREHKRSVYSRDDLGHHLRLADAELRQRRSSACLQSCRLLELVLGDHHTTIQSSSLLLSYQTSQVIAGSKLTGTHQFSVHVQRVSRSVFSSSQRVASCQSCSS